MVLEGWGGLSCDPTRKRGVFGPGQRKGVAEGRDEAVPQTAPHPQLQPARVANSDL